MPSPFPGMDPYLESRWQDVHTRIMVYAVDALSEQLPEGLVAWVEEGVSVDADEFASQVSPDVNITGETTADGESGEVAIMAPPIAVEPLIVPVSEPITERHIEILDRTSGQQVITAIEFLSPTNKIPGEGRERYLTKQREYLEAGVNLVEVDLVRAGQFTLAIALSRLRPPEHTTSYVCVRRATRPWEAEVYPISLREPLREIRIPLRPSDQDVLLNLQELVGTCYDRGRYAAKLDYTAPPVPPLPPSDAEWADGLLKSAGLR
jgi:hypothetical protein